MKPLLVSLLCLCALSAQAEPLRYGFAGGADTAAAWVAQEQGIFARHGLDVTMTQVANSALFPAALQAGSFDIAAPTAPLVLQADAGGLDLVIISGGSVVGGNGTSMVALARPSLGLRAATDFIGHKVAVPGLGGFMDVLFREWLRRGGVAPARIEFFELGQGGMADALRGGSADAVVVSDPVATRIEQLGVGAVVTSITSGLPDGLPVIVYAARRDWAESHADTARAFAAAISEATDYAMAHPDTTRLAIARALKINADLANLPALHAGIGVTDIELWLPILHAQGLVPGDFSAARIKF